MGGHHQMRGKEVIIEEVSESFPHFRTYAQCQNKAFMLGSFTFLSMASGIYIAQELMKSKLPFGRHGFLVAPILLGSLSGYVVTRHNTKICQNMWMALEEKHSVVTPLSERMQEQQKSSSSSSS